MNRKIFFDLYRKNLDKDGRLTQREVAAIDKFLDLFECHRDYFTIPQWAYAFATTFHETAHTFESNIEAYWLSEEWRRRNLRYYPYYGRGFVHLTWEENYRKYSIILGVDLVKNPDLALQTNHAFLILIHGMKTGNFTGRKISDYINMSKKDYRNARRVINGTDKRDLIASYAEHFEGILIAALK